MEETKTSGEVAFKVIQVYYSREERSDAGRRFFSLTLEPADEILITSASRLQALLEALSRGWFEGEEELVALPDELCEDVVDELPYTSEVVLEEPLEMPQEETKTDFLDVEFLV